MTIRVAVLTHFSPELQQQVRQTAGPELDLVFPASGSVADIAAIVADVEYIVVRQMNLPVAALEQARNVRLIHAWGAGIDKIPLTEALARNIVVARNAGRNAVSVADLTLGLMLACLRRIPQTSNALRGGQWAAEHNWRLARDLAGARVGLVGYGAIAQAVARRLAGFDCKVFYTRASGADPDVPGFLPLEGLIRSVDIVSLHVPLLPSTVGLMSRDRMLCMQPGSFLINTSRGPLVDEVALAEVLRSGHLGAAGLDVFHDEPVSPSNPLLALDNVVATPHMGGQTRENLERVIEQWAGNLLRFANGAPIEDRYLVTGE